MALTAVQQRKYEKLTRKFMDAAVFKVGDWLQGPVTVIGGVPYAGYIDDPSTFDYTEGVIPGGSGSSVLVPLTTVTKGCIPVSAQRHLAKSPDFVNDGNLLEWAQAGANVLNRKAEHLVLGAIISNDPTNTADLDSGQENWKAETIDEAIDNLNVLAGVVGSIEAEGYAPEDILIVMSATGAKNFNNARAYLPSSFQNQFDVRDGMPTYQGSPIRKVMSAAEKPGKGLASFGGVTSNNFVALVIGRRGISYNLDGPEVVNNMERRIDGSRTIELEMSVSYGIRDAEHLGTIKNT